MQAATPQSPSQSLDALVTTYLQAQNEQAMQQAEPILMAQRRELAQRFFESSEAAAQTAFSGTEGKRFSLLRQVGPHNLPRNGADKSLIDRILSRWRRSYPPPSNCLLAAMLLFQPHELPLLKRLSHAPDWLQPAYADFLLTSPGVFNQKGEADAFADYFMQAVDRIHQAIFADAPGSSQADTLRKLFVQKANFIQFYFNEKNLCRTYQQRAEIFESWALSQGAPLACNFRLHPPEDTAQGGRQIRFGVLAAHFSPQTETFLLLSYFDRLPKERFSVTLYSLRQTGHHLENHCKSRADDFVVLPSRNGYSQNAERIRADDLDILLVGTNTSAVANPVMLMALYRMARIQLIVENSPVSTGFTATDYYLTSYFNEPDPDAPQRYSESLYRIPGMLNYYAYHLDQEPRTITMDRHKLGLPADGVVYFSGANFYKILPELSERWARILSQVENSFLVLMPFNPNWSSRYHSRPFMQRLKAQMAAAGVDFNRLRLVNKVPTRSDLHAVMELCDIYLDSFPYAGACSMMDPLLVGLPVVTRKGSTLRGGLAGAMLKGAGLAEMISEDADGYERRAVALGRNPDQRNQERGHIRQTLSRYNPFFDTRACGVKFGAALTDMVERDRRAEIQRMGESAEALKARAEKLSANLARTTSPFLRHFTDPLLIQTLLIPYIREVAEKSQAPFHLVDLRAGDGGFAAPFLAAGWHGDLYDPDPGQEARLSALAQKQEGRARVLKGQVHPAALAYPQLGLKRLDLLRLHGKDWGADGLLAHDFAKLPPCLVLLETSGENARAAISAMNARHRYEAFCLGFSAHGLAAVSLGELPDSAGLSHRILFFRQADRGVFSALLVRGVERMVKTSQG